MNGWDSNRRTWTAVIHQNKLSVNYLTTPKHPPSSPLQSDVLWTLRFDLLLQSPKTGAVSNGMPSVSGSSLDFLWLAAPPLSMGSPPIVPAAAHTQVPPVSSICNHGHHFLLERDLKVYCHPLVLPFGAQTWSLQPQQPPTKFGTPPHLANQGMMAISPAMGQNGASLAGQPKMDSKSVPSPTQTSESIYHETRLNNQANPPPPASSEYIARDSGCGLWGKWSREVFSLQSKEAKKLFLFHGFADETPSDYQCNLGPDGRRRDADERPELCRGTVKFVASKEYIHGQLSKRDF
ncbi:hypothetical protein OIU78_012323 [Salix suchowensis]|nr:hypothetical protein OIU78_012323 [Salix suchowensis]